MPLHRPLSNGARTPSRTVRAPFHFGATAHRRAPSSTVLHHARTIRAPWGGTRRAPRALFYIEQCAVRVRDGVRDDAPQHPSINQIPTALSLLSRVGQHRRPVGWLRPAPPEAPHPHHTQPRCHRREICGCPHTSPNARTDQP